MLKNQLYFQNLKDVMRYEKVAGFCKVITARDLTEGYLFL